MPFPTFSTVLVLWFLQSALHVPTILVTAYSVQSNAMQPTSSLASKVIYQSPPIENIYKEYVVSSKPLTLRKHIAKMKKTKQESKIYYIPIPPLPYRFIPNVGYDYQPMRINPIVQEVQTPTATDIPQTMPTRDAYSGSKQFHHKQYKPLVHPPQGLPTATDMKHGPQTDTVHESKIIRLHKNKYSFNGRPIKLQVAHAQPKYHLTPQNLKTKLYFNKNIIF